MCQDFRATGALAARVRKVTRPGLTFVRRPAPPPAFFEALRRRLGDEAVLTDPAELVTYDLDAGQDRATPDGVVFPRTADELLDVVRLSKEHGVVLVPRAAGTSLSGGTIAAVGGVVVGLSRMRAVRSVDPVARQAVVDPCVVNLDLQDALAPDQLFFPPDPASQRASTIAGNIGENAGGPHCFKYGVTTSYVQALELVLPSGESVRAGGRASDYPEYDFAGVFTGSEGTLGFITQATVRVVRNPPAAVVLMAIFDSLGAAAATVSDIIARGLVPAALEMMDREIIRAVEAYVHIGLPVEAAVVLIAEVDGYAASLEEQAAVIRSLCEAHGAREVRLAYEKEERDRLWFARKSAAGAIARLAPAYYLQDGTVPRSRLAELMTEIERVAKVHRLSICNVFHAGDGNLHPLILFDPDKEDEAARVVSASREILEKCIEVGGNITGEHGVGVEKMLEMRMQFTPGEIEVMREVKALFDPANLCNPSKILPDATVDPSEWAPRAAVPRPVAAEAWWEPEGKDEVAALLRERQAGRSPIVVVGGGTKIGRDGAPRPAVLSTRRMSRVVEYAPKDLYLRAEAGMTVGDVQRLAAEDGLWWPVAHPWPEATLGGVVATNWNGPARWRFGALRNLVLGGVVVLPDGRDMRVGGKVVKNVAGYDLTKLHVGAFGTLGVLTEVNLKLAARPSAEESLAVAFASVDEAIGAALRVFQGSLVASNVLVFAGDRGGLDLPEAGAATVVVTAAGHPADVREELRLTAPLLSEAGSAPSPLGATGESVWSVWHRAARAGDSLAPRLRLGVPATCLAELAAQPGLTGARLAIDATSGVVWAALRPGIEAETLTALQGAARAMDGYALVLGGPDPLLGRVDPWGYRPSMLPYMTSLQSRWDPAGILGPPFARSKSCR